MSKKAEAVEALRNASTNLMNDALEGDPLKRVHRSILEMLDAVNELIAESADALREESVAAEKRKIFGTSGPITVEEAKQPENRRIRSVDDLAEKDANQISMEIDVRNFVLLREHDVSGVSGTGVVAEGIEFTDGRVALRWVAGAHRSTVFWDSIHDVIAIHGHDGATEVLWL